FSQQGTHYAQLVDVLDESGQHRVAQRLRDFNSTLKSYQFEIISTIGSGNFGIITDWGKHLIYNIHREAWYLRRLKSQYVVGYYDSWVEGKTLFIQMELCLDNLRNIIHMKQQIFNRKPEQPMTLYEYFISCEIFKEILECVQYLHDLNPPVIHRGIHPNNILIAKNVVNGRYVNLDLLHIIIKDFLGTVLKTNMGLPKAKELGDTAHTMGLGAGLYRAPEVTMSKYYNHKADIYSLAIICGELFDLDLYSGDLALVASDIFEIDVFKDWESDFRYSTINTNINEPVYLLKKLLDDMLAHKWHNRPECEEVLAKYNEWSIDRNILLNDSEFDDILDSIDKIETQIRERDALGVLRAPGDGCHTGAYLFAFKAFKDLLLTGERHLIANTVNELNYLGAQDATKVKSQILWQFSQQRPHYEQLVDILDESGQHRVAQKLRDFNSTLKSLQLEIISTIASGQFSVVYKMKHKTDQKAHIYDRLDTYDTHCIHREAGYLRRLRSQYVVEYYDSWVEGSTLFIQIELFSHNLIDLLNIKPQMFNRKSGQPMDLYEYFVSCEIFKEILECVQYLHELNPPHTTGLGYPLYRAPEVDVYKYYDHKVDIYSVGLIGEKIFDLDLYSDNDKQIRNIHKEMEYLSQVDLQYVVQYFDSWKELNTVYIQLEMCSQNLTNILEIKPQVFKRLPNESMNSYEYIISCEIFKEILECVQYLHENNFIHRDLKPDNILIADNILNGRFLKLCDFGLVTEHDNSVHYITAYKHTADVGTMKYIAPEVASDDMLDRKWNKRPECAEVLAKYNEWSIDTEILLNDSQFDNTLDSIHKIETQIRERDK
ncbi:unnamed protein product, partial [Oppiella nova]